MPLADVFSLLVLGQGKSGLDVARWALAHPERVSALDAAQHAAHSL